jgi:signal transduction histidine kinase
VEVRARVGDGAWETTVADDGRGIAAPDPPRVFGPFFRTADAEREGPPGGGPGPAVARALVGGTAARCR